MEDEDLFFASLAERVSRNKAKTEFIRRASNDVATNEMLNNQKYDDMQNDVIVERSVEET